MASILSFRPSQRAGAAHTGSGASAEIVFFPGVRYERWADEAPDAKAKKRSRRRDKLELQD